MRGYRALPADFVAAWPGEKLVLEWRSGGAMQAGMLFLRHGAWASYHSGWASDEGRAAFAHGPMLMTAAAMLAERGVTTLDLGTVDAEAAPGLAHFKIGTGAVVRPLGATVWVLPR
jgi:lipid II:glycine glycyltransferase (peptidoglycan interpeptide bridge formation enzyme)